MEVTNYRISTTNVEAFRLYLDDSDASAFMTLERLVEQLTTRQEATPLMKRGSSLHEILEFSPEERKQRFALNYQNIDCYYHLDNFWDASSIDKLENTAGGINEIKTELVIPYSKTEQITIVAKADKLLGYEVIDYKTTSHFDIDKYSNSAQWKIYCWAFGAKRFIYRIFEIAEERKTGILSIKDEHIFDLYPYQNMELEMKALIFHFVEFCKEQNIPQALGLKGFGDL